jgi:hypothetical protein
LRFDEKIREVVKSFRERRVDRLSVYIEGFGGFFISRSKDGFVIGYMDKNKRFGIDDHVTVFYGKQGLEGMHRKVTDVRNDVYMKFETSYFAAPEGIKKLQQDLQEKRDMRMMMKVLYVVLYRLADLALTQGEKMGEKARLLDVSEARKKGLKSPCIYVRLGFMQRSILYMYDRNILLQTYLTNVLLGEQTTKLFKEQNLPGIQITKHQKSHLA